MTQNNQVLPPSLGTTLKIAISAELGTYHMDDVDFVCRIYSSYGKSDIVIHKGDEEMVRVDEDTYIAVIDTKKVGTGQYYMKFTAMLPDTDVVGGFREEDVTVKLNVPTIHN